MRASSASWRRGAQCSSLSPGRAMAAFRIDAILGKTNSEKCEDKHDGKLSDFKQTTSPCVTEGGECEVALRHCSLFVMFVFLANLKSNSLESNAHFSRLFLWM